MLPKDEEEEQVPPDPNVPVDEFAATEDDEPSDDDLQSKEDQMIAMLDRLKSIGMQLDPAQIEGIRQQIRGTLLNLF